MENWERALGSSGIVGGRDWWAALSRLKKKSKRRARLKMRLLHFIFENDPKPDYINHFRKSLVQQLFFQKFSRPNLFLLKSLIFNSVRYSPSKSSPQRLNFYFFSYSLHFILVLKIHFSIRKLYWNKQNQTNNWFFYFIYNLGPKFWLC